mgnify:CR=1 FL=1
MRHRLKQITADNETLQSMLKDIVMAIEEFEGRRKAILLGEHRYLSPPDRGYKKLGFTYSSKPHYTIYGKYEGFSGLKEGMWASQIVNYFFEKKDVVVECPAGNWLRVYWEIKTSQSKNLVTFGAPVGAFGGIAKAATTVMHTFHNNFSERKRFVALGSVATDDSHYKNSIDLGRKSTYGDIAVALINANGFLSKGLDAQNVLFAAKSAAGDVIGNL